MPVCKLDAAFVQHATCPPNKKKIEYRDTTIIGFSLEVRASGGKTTTYGTSIRAAASGSSKSAA